MMVLFSFEGRDFVVRATPFGKNGYFHGKVLYADPIREMVEAIEAPPSPPHRRAESVEGKKPYGATLREARKHPNLGTWDGQAKSFWNWLRENNRRQGLVGTLFNAYREATEQRKDATLGFYVVAAGERHDMWSVTPNKNGTRFTLTVKD